MPGRSGQARRGGRLPRRRRWRKQGEVAWAEKNGSGRPPSSVSAQSRHGRRHSNSWKYAPISRGSAGNVDLIAFATAFSASESTIGMETPAVLSTTLLYLIGWLAVSTSRYVRVSGES